jgi:hypothetical protein
MQKARFSSDELYRLVYTREYDEPDWDHLNTKYKGRIAYMLLAPHAVMVHPYNAGKYYMVQIIEKIFVCRDDEVRLPDGEDPSLVCYGSSDLDCD